MGLGFRWVLGFRYKERFLKQGVWRCVGLGFSDFRLTKMTSNIDPASAIGWSPAQSQHGGVENPLWAITP